MSINWVMLSPSATSTQPFTPLPNEQTLLSSNPRISFSLTTPAHFPGKQQQPFSLSASSGKLHLTNRRLIFLPEKTTPQLQSFAAPILSLHDSHVAAPWFGPNVWTALLQPTQGGGIPTPPSGVVEVKFTFKEGGAFDFHAQYERVRERLQQAIEVSRLNQEAGAGDGGGISSAGAAGLNGVDVSNVNLEELPAYQERGDGPLIPPIMPAAAPVRTAAQEPTTDGDSREQASRQRDTPAEPPPGYDESMQDHLERRLSRG